MFSLTIETKIGLMTERSLIFGFQLFCFNKALVTVAGTQFAILFDLVRIRDFLVLLNITLAELYWFAFRLAALLCLIVLKGIEFGIVGCFELIA